MQETISDSGSGWIGELGAELGAIGLFAILVIFLILKFLRTHNANSKDSHISIMDYLSKTVTPRLDRLQDDHQNLSVSLAKLPTREEIQGTNDKFSKRIHTQEENIHKKMNGHENQCQNYSPRSP